MENQLIGLRKRLATIGIRKELIMMMMVSGLFFLITVIAIMIPFFRWNATNYLATQQKPLLTAIQTEIDAKITTASTQLAAVANVLSPEIMVNPILAQRFLENRVGIGSIFDNGLDLFTSDGKILATTVRQPEHSLIDRFYPFIEQAIAANASMISTPFHSSKPQHHPVVQFCAPVRNPAGTLIGILSGGIRLDGQHLIGSFAQQKIGKTGYFYLYSTDRTMLVHPDPTRILQKDVPVGSNLLFDRAIGGWEGTGYTVNSRGLKTIASFRHLQNIPWILASNYPAAEAFLPANRATIALTFIICLLGTIWIIITWVVLRNVTHPVELLTAHLQQLDHLHGDERQFHPQGHLSQEITLLSASFNHMINDLDYQRQEAARLTRIYRIRSEVNQQIIRKPQPLEMFQSVCDTLLADNTFIMAWVGVANEDGGYAPVVAAGFPIEQLAPVHSCAHLTGDTPQIITDITAATYRQHLCPAGQKLYQYRPFNAVATYHIRSQQTVAAILVVYTADSALLTHHDEQCLLDELVGDIAFALDMAEQQHRQELAQQQLELSATVFENSNEGIIITDVNERIISVNRAFCEITGYNSDEVFGQTPRLLKSQRHGRDFYQAMWNAISETGSWQGEIWNRRKDGQVYPERLSISVVRNGQNSVSHYIAIFSDISQIKESQQQRDYLEWHDPLTDLPNRRMLYNHLSQAIEVAQRKHQSVALLCLDLDHFKDINDSFGHLTGDALLQLIAKRLRERMRGSDMVARLSGDEFIVLLDELEHQDHIPMVAEEILNLLGQAFRLDTGIEIQTSVSIGIALFPDHGENAMELLQKVDSALHQAKRQGRAQFAYYNEEMTAKARERINLSNHLRQALEHDELLVYYQPQVDMTTGAIVGAEALMRWHNPELGMVSPVRFIPLAEEIGCIIPMGEWILRQVCTQGKAWLNAGHPPLTLAVNLSALQFHQEDIVQSVRRILDETGYPAQQLVLEVTETALIHKEQETIDQLQKLHDIGVLLAMDDFGTGYSSLAYLKYFPLSLLKIDKSFVDDLPHGRNDCKMVSAIIQMGRGLGFKLLAEGVERIEQMAYLQTLGCDMYQGYYCSKPVPAQEFIALTTKRGNNLQG